MLLSLGHGVGLEAPRDQDRLGLEGCSLGFCLGNNGFGLVLVFGITGGLEITS